MVYRKMTPHEEHCFWLSILEEHALFVRDYLSPTEREWQENAQKYMDSFAKLREKLQTVRKDSTVESSEMVHLSREVYPFAQGYYHFESQIQALRIQNSININIPPSYFNGTLDENGEYLRLLQHYVNGQDAPPLPLVDLLDLWLTDQVGHAALLVRSLDGVELLLLREADTIKQLFQAHLLKNEAIKGYLRSIPPNFPAQLAFAREVSASVLRFNEFVEHVVTLYKDNEVFNSTTLTFLEHHFPEACYFLHKLYFYAQDIAVDPRCNLDIPNDC
ncbi:MULTISPECIES: DUF2935 domain-containing protein [Bacillus]|uniref:DUF2935 domain-containing protein n=1 Tax=Bacillus TaxID=1386 RepID=UPI000BB79B20|nr:MULTISPECIES: DUF2935 domain-containing protein [Bacillus]